MPSVLILLVSMSFGFAGAFLTHPLFKYICSVETMTGWPPPAKPKPAATKAAELRSLGPRYRPPGRVKPHLGKIGQDQLPGDLVKCKKMHAKPIVFQQLPIVKKT